MATQNSKVNNSEAMKLNCLYEDWEVCPANLDSHKKPSDEQNTFEISNLKCELEIAIKERDEYKALLKEIEHIRTERNSYEDTINTLRDENAGLKKAIRNIKSVDTDIEKMKKDFKNLKDDQKNNYNRFFKDYEDFKAKIDFAVKSTQEIIKQSSEEEDKTRDQKIISLEANVYSLEYLKAEEIEKNKKLSEKIEKLQRINGKKDQAISELSRKNNEVLAKFKRLKIDYDNLFEEHSNLKKKNNMWCNYLFQGITNSLDKKKLDSLYSTPVGLPNIGQTCYLNSLLQVLVYSPDFIKLTYFSANSLLLSISKIADNINAGSLDSWYRSFYEEFISMFPQVQAYREQDAKEVLFMILSQMNEIDQKRLFNVVVNKNYSCSEGHIFPNTDLSFLIIVQPNSSIENALQDLYDEQNFDELWCQECGSLRKQARYVSSVEFPQYLIFYTPKNKRTNFSFPESLEIYGEAYSLYAIICHKQNILYGHYLAYVCLQGVWYKCDDSRVKKQAPDYKSAYLLFYQK